MRVSAFSKAKVLNAGASLRKAAPKVASEPAPEAKADAPDKPLAKAGLPKPAPKIRR